MSSRDVRIVSPVLTSHELTWREDIVSLALTSHELTWREDSVSPALLTCLIAAPREDADILWRKLRANNIGKLWDAPSVYSLFQNSNIIQASHFKEAVSTTEVSFPPHVSTCVDSAATRYSSVTSEFMSLTETSYWTQQFCCMALYSPSVNILWSCIYRVLWNVTPVAVCLPYKTSIWN